MGETRRKEGPNGQDMEGEGQGTSGGRRTLLAVLFSATRDMGGLGPGRELGTPVQRGSEPQFRRR